MMKKFVGECLTPAIIEKAYMWKTNSRYRYDMRFEEGIAGCDALFIAIDDNCGIKFFHTPEVAKMSFWISRILCHFNYTPKTWDLRMVAYKGEFIWCYMQELCTVLLHINKSYGNARRERIYEKAESILKRRISSTLMYDHDFHYGNLGITRKGKIVCIDVGHMSYEESMMKYL
jgi:hypothetical protein